jgi:hypothetical protein
MLNTTFSNISRYTRSNRFHNLDPLLAEIISKFRINSILDVGVSSGETSLDLYNIISRDIELYISDPFSFLYRRRLFFIDLFYNYNMRFVGISIFKKPIKNEYKNWFLDKIGKVVFKLFGNFKLQHTNLKEFLLCDDILKLLHQKKINWLDFDLFNLNNFDKKFDMVRIMNVLNRELFTEKEFDFALTNLKAIMNEKGLLFIGRSFNNDSNKFKVSVYTFQDGKFILYSDLNGGSDFKDNITL